MGVKSSLRGSRAAGRAEAGAAPRAMATIMPIMRRIWCSMKLWPSMQKRTHGDPCGGVVQRWCGRMAADFGQGKNKGRWLLGAMNEEGKNSTQHSIGTAKKENTTGATRPYLYGRQLWYNADDKALGLGAPSRNLCGKVVKAVSAL